MHWDGEKFGHRLPPSLSQSWSEHCFNCLRLDKLAIVAENRLEQLDVVFRCAKESGTTEIIDWFDKRFSRISVQAVNELSRCISGCYCMLLCVAGWNDVSSMPSISKMFSRIYASSVVSLALATIKPASSRPQP